MFFAPVCKLGCNTLSLHILFFENAISVYSKAIENDPKNVFAYSNIAYAYEKMNKASKGMEYLLKATQVDPNDAVVWFDLGAAYAKQNQNLKAIECYEKSFSLNPKYYKSCLSLAISYEKKRDLEKAAEYYVKAMSLTEEPRLKEAILRQVTKSGGGNT